MSRITYKTTIRDSYTPEELKNTFKFDWKSWRENPEILGPCWTLNNFKPVMMFCNPLDATFRKLYHDNLIFITQEDAEAAGELFKAYASIVMQQVHGTDVQLDLFPGTKVTRIPGRAKIYQFYAQSKKVY